MAVEVISRSFYVCLNTKGSTINPLSVASIRWERAYHGGIEMKYENKTKEEMGYEEMKEEEWWITTGLPFFGLDESYLELNDEVVE
jgi:hypothetical protein